jgi:2-polyprenyl-3-methyl-5-hydroxy-6-metoxy-1,4-benzoquinol methylase
METDNQKIKCPICNLDDVEFYAIKKGYNFYRSKNCGLIFLWPLPKDINIYNTDYFCGATGGHGYVDYEKNKAPMSKTFRKYLEIMGKYSKERGCLLDIGAATGYFLELASRDNWQGMGIEISEYAAQKARNKGLKVLCGTLGDVDLLNNKFNAITMWDVLEHLSDPNGDIAIIAGALKRGSILAINTPDSDSAWARIFGQHWHLLIPPEHLFLFGIKSLEILLNKNNFEILEIKKIGKSFTLAYFFSVLYNWQNIALWKKLSHICSGGFFSKIAIPINLRDNIFIIAKKI